MEWILKWTQDAKSGPDSIVGIGDDTDIAIDMAKGHTHWS